MRENHDALHERMSTQVPDWTALAALFAEAGMTNRYGKPPQAEATRKLWRQVHRDVEASRVRRPSGHPPSIAPTERTGAAPSREISPPRTKPGSDDEIRALLKNSGRAIPKPIHE
jgi:hypothetical protein